jgi:hypothetical protein
MNLITIFFISVFFVSLSFAQESNETPVITSEAPQEDDTYNARKGHWVTTFGFEATEYEMPLNFIGAKESFSDENKQLYGGRLGFGREFHLFWRLKTTTMFEGFYMGTLFEKSINAAPEEVDEEFAYIKRTGHIWGGEASQSLSFLFDLKTKNPLLDEMTYLVVEPFIFAGVGMARAYNRLNYHYDTTIDEDYRLRVNDDLTIASVGGGISFTSLTGFFLYLKATQYRLDITKRREEGLSKLDGEAAVAIDNVNTNLDSNLITVYAIGGGYKF